MIVLNFEATNIDIFLIMEGKIAFFLSKLDIVAKVVPEIPTGMENKYGV